MTIEKLKRYRELKSELEDVNWKLQTVCGSVQGSQEDYPYILQNHHISGIEPKNYKLLERKSDLKAQIKEIEDFVNGIPFYKVRKAVRLYYIEPIDESGKKANWNTIANSFKDGTTENAIKKRVNRYLKENL